LGILAGRSGPPIGGAGFRGVAKPRSPASNNLVTGGALAAGLLPACTMS
jgi:hypothetical protein